jgi:hypothetical protein
MNRPLSALFRAGCTPTGNDPKNRVTQRDAPSPSQTCLAARIKSIARAELFHFPTDLDQHVELILIRGIG